MSQNTNPTVINSLYGTAIGTTSSNAYVSVFEARDPIPQDVNYPIQKRWFNTNSKFEWILTSFSNASGILQANWQLIGFSGISAETLTGNSGGAVPVDTNNNINVIADGTIATVVGNPAAHTLTITSLLQFDGNSGVASPTAGVVNIIGTGIVSTSASGNTVTISSTGGGFVATLEGNTGGKVSPDGTGNINVVGDSTTINVAGTTNTLTISASGTVPTLFVEDTGTATPFSNALQIRGGTGISTNGTGSIVTITNTGSAGANFVLNFQTFTTSGTYVPTTGMKYCIIQTIGGGGAGGGSQTTNGSQVAAGSGGGGGEYASAIFSAATIGVSQIVTIGAGGTGILGSEGTAGGTTSVGSLISSNGGQPGLNGTAESGGAGGGGLGGTGGTGGNFRTPGVPGEAGFGIFSPLLTLSGAGGSAVYGSGGNAIPTNGNGNVGLGYGGGGGGSCNITSQGTAKIGGNGASGVAIITEYIFT